MQAGTDFPCHRAGDGAAGGLRQWRSRADEHALRDHGPDEFAILPPKPLECREDLAALPEPTPGGANRTDPDAQADAIVALGGNPVPAGRAGADGGLVGHAARYGVTPGIRNAGAEDLEFRRENDGRLLERLFNVNVYYRPMPTSRWTSRPNWPLARAGVRTPSAPPPQPGEDPAHNA
jgi:hypothetical protein